MAFNQAVSGSRYRISKRVVVAVIVMLLAVVALAIRQDEAGAVPASGRHDYQSSVDGATIPCSIYLPEEPETSPLPLYVMLHPFGGPLGDNNQDLQDLADENDIIILTPVGRNPQTFYQDGYPGDGEPSIMDEFTSGSTGWTLPGSWYTETSGGESYLVQGTNSSSYSMAVRADSSASVYAITADITVTSSTANSCTGIFFRRQNESNQYWAGLTYDGTNRKFAFCKQVNGTWTTLASNVDDKTWAEDTKYKLKVLAYEDYTQLFVDDSMIFLANNSYPNMPGYTDVGTTYTSGPAGLIARNCTAEFDNFRVQDEFNYGATDIIDVVQQALDEFSVDENYIADPSQVVIGGYSMGGCGTWALGLQNPELFTAMMPNQGTTDFANTYSWVKAHYPDQTNPWAFLYPEQDMGIVETANALLGSSDPLNSSDPVVMAGLRQASGRFILENGLNTSFRIQDNCRDTLIPNTTAPDNGDDALAIRYVGTLWWIPVVYSHTVTGNPADNYGNPNPKPTYAVGYQPWCELHEEGMCEGIVETSAFSAEGDMPEGDPDYTDMDEYFDNYPYDNTVPYGGHAVGGAQNNKFIDTGDKLLQADGFVDRALTDTDQHIDPDEVAYKTYFSELDSAWWLGLTPSDPEDEDTPALARAERASDTQINVHVKNVATTTLDLKRMARDEDNLDLSDESTITITVDNDTQPEAEAVTDTVTETDLELVGEWYPLLSYTVTKNGNPVTPTVTGTKITIPDVSTTSDSTITVTIPTGHDDANILSGYDPGFENETGQWLPFEHNDPPGTLSGIYDVNTMECLSHSGSRSLRIKDCTPTTSALMAQWVLDPKIDDGIDANKSYSFSAFVKTRVLNSNSRVYENGKYSENPAYNSYVGICLVWYDESNNFVGWSTGPGIKGTNEWTPMEIQATSPATADKVQPVLFVVNHDDQGFSGSVWFDDVALRSLN
ncbi:MAG: prolyl oligopeptidase family serine peptidase [Actinobacteria bacterium]|nr:prolyl oligopeptidase family serine peptidase [Actinomycetota bacterium]